MCCFDMLRSLAYFAVAALAACAEGEEPDREPPPPGGYNMVDPVRVDDRGGAAAAVTPGIWRPDSVGAMRGVAFTTLEGDPLLRMYCDGRLGMVVDRTGLMQSGPTEMMTFWVGDQSRRLAVNPTGPDGTVLRAVLPHNGQLAAALQAGPAPIRVSVGEEAPLTLPASPLVAMLAADCRKI